MRRQKENDESASQTKVERWGIFEFSCKGRTEGNPFTDYTISGRFKSKSQNVQVDGFYDGEGIYKVRFMPSFMETYEFEIKGSFSDEVYIGSFEVTKPLEGNHGPVRGANTFHFAYEDGTAYYPIGTTCYVWELQDERLQKQTLETLKENAFNKIRFCIFPKHYAYNLHEPISYPYEGTPMDSSVLNKDNFNEYDSMSEGNHWDFKRFNPKHFQHIEDCIAALGRLGIEGDLIVMHPYDRWGFSNMSKEEDDLYWKYVVARFSAYRNVWWSHGGRLKGESPARIKFLAQILKEAPGQGLAPIKQSWDDICAAPDGMLSSFSEVKDYYLFYYNFFRPSFREFYFDEDTLFKVDIIDTWNMTIKEAGIFRGRFTINLPGREYMAVRMQKVQQDNVPH